MNTNQILSDCKTDFDSWYRLTKDNLKENNLVEMFSGDYLIEAEISLTIKSELKTGCPAFEGYPSETFTETEITCNWVSLEMFHGDDDFKMPEDLFNELLNYIMFNFG